MKLMRKHGNVSRRLANLFQIELHCVRTIKPSIVHYCEEANAQLTTF